MKPHKPKFAGARGNVVPLRRETYVRYETRDPAPIRALHGWTAHASFEAAMALAVCREHPGDWTPELLLWHYAGQQQHTEMIASRLVRLVLLKGAIAGLKPCPDRVRAIVFDAMRIVRDRISVASQSRSKSLGMRKRDYLALRGTAETSILSAIDRGLAKFIAAWQGKRIHNHQAEGFNGLVHRQSA